MKRVISISLVIVILCSMLPLSVFAVEPMPVSGFGAGADILDDSNVKDFGIIVLGKEENTLDIPIKWENFDFLPGQTPGREKLNAEAMDNLKLTFTDKDTADLFGFRPDGNYDGVSIHPWNKNKDATITLTSKNIGPASGYIYVTYDDSKNPPVDSAKIPIKGEFVDPTINKLITSIRDKQLGSTRSGILYNNKKVTKDELDLELASARPGDEVLFAIDSDMFEWEPDITYMFAMVRKSTLDNNHISVIQEVVAGSNTIENTQIENINGQAYVVVRFKEFFDRTEAKDFDFTISLGRYKERHEPTSIRLAGTLENDNYDASKDHDYIFVGDGIVINATAACKDVDLDLGYGATLRTNLQPGKKYYVRATDLLSTEDREIMKTFESIKKVLNIYSQNILAPGAEVMSFKLDRVYHVYDAKGELLGLSNTKLPFRSKYYFSVGELFVESEEFESIGLGYNKEEANNYPENINENPLTGGYAYVEPVATNNGATTIDMVLPLVAVAAKRTRKVEKE